MKFSHYLIQAGEGGRAGTGDGLGKWTDADAAKLEHTVRPSLPFPAVSLCTSSPLIVRGATQ